MASDKTDQYDEWQKEEDIRAEKRRQELWADPFYADFPHLYRDMDVPHSSMSWGCTVGPGWKPLIRELCMALVELDSGVYFVQIKEKFGGLRIYHAFDRTSTGQMPTDWQREEAHRLISKTTQKANETCETCGQPGTLREGSWIYTACDLHCGA